MESGKLLLSLCFFFILGLAKAQDMRLLEYADKMNERYLAVKVKTDKIADSLSIIKRVDDGKSVIQLSHFVDGFPRFRATSNINAAATTSTSAVWPGGAARLNLTGTGITLGIWDEGKARIDHQEFGGRVIVKDDSPYISNHATHVSGTMVASGVVPTAKGMSYQANLNSYDWNNDVSEMAAATAYGLQVSNHSWGYLAGWHYGYAGDNKWVWFGDTTFSRTIDYGFGAYEQTSFDWDTLAWMAPDFLIVKASSNDRYQGPSEQPVQHWLWNSGNGWVLSSSVREKDGENGFDCIPWNGVAKNILTIGAVNDIPAGYQAPSDVVLAGFSSTGPTDDGRIKPDLVANGVDVYSAYSSSSTVYGSYSGTSMATPNTSGSIGLILEHQRNLTGSTLMRAATMKALLIHTADEAGTTTGPDYTYGWGLLNTKKAALLMSRNSDNGFNFNIRELTLSQGDTIKIPVYTNGIEPLSATMVWTDRPSIKFTAFVNDTSHMLVNDLDLRLINTSLQKYYPWKLKGSTPAAAATKGDNIVDNVEKVDAGNTIGQETWYVQITHKGTLVGGQQDFSLVLSGIAVTQHTLNLLVLLEGLYNGSSSMRQAMDISGPHSGPGIADLIEVELHDSGDYNQIAYTVSNVELLTNGLATVLIPGDFSGSYYITVKHRNSIETTSAMPVSFSAGIINYSFDNPGKAYGNNLKLLDTSMYGLFAGNVNADEIIDQNDINSINSTASGFSSGYLTADVNGDGKVDASDLIITDNNAANFVVVKKP